MIVAVTVLLAEKKIKVKKMGSILVPFYDIMYGELALDLISLFCQTGNTAPLPTGTLLES